MSELQRLKLRVKDDEDLAILSALLQDALVPLRDLTYRPRERRLVLLASRFCWESDGAATAALASDDGAAAAQSDAAFLDTPPPFARVNCALVVDRVGKVETRGLNLAAKDQLLNLLALSYRAPFLTFAFSGQGELRLTVERLALHLEDVGSPWPTEARPRHALDEPEASG